MEESLREGILKMAEEKIKAVKDRSLTTIVRDVIITAVVIPPIHGGIAYLINDHSFMENLTSSNTISYTIAGMIGIGLCRLITGIGYFNDWRKPK